MQETPFSIERQLDINNANLSDIRNLPIDSTVADKIYEYLLTYGRFNSIYDLRKIKELSPEDFELIKPLIYISKPRYKREGSRYVHTIQKSLTEEERPTYAAVEEWQDLAISPININKASVDDLVQLENVSLIDAIAVMEHLRIRKEIKSLRELRNDVVGLSDYGYRNMRGFITFADQPEVKFSGNYRINYDWGEDLSIEDNLASLTQAKEELNNKADFLKVGLTDSDLEAFRSRLSCEYDYFLALKNKTNLSNRLRCRVGNNTRFGIWTNKDFSQTKPINEVKGFFSLYDVNPFKKVFFGDFRIALGQGLLLDNSNEWVARTHTRTQGVFNDLTANDFFTLRGIAAQLQLDNRLNSILFYSRNYRDGILNPDRTINYYIITEPRLPTNYKNFTEENYGGATKFDLSKLGFLPYGTYIAINGLVCNYDKEFSPKANYLELPNDNDYLNDPNYICLSSGKQRVFGGFDFRTAINNVSLEGELAKQKNGGKAYLIKTRAQYNYLYVITLFRHYDLNYDNPYHRGFAEETRFANTLLARGYRLIDPTFSALQDFPIPKAEQGIFTEMRYQISRQITFTRVYLDVWRNIAWGLNNYRFQGEIEYRPVFPLRIRFRQKIQNKYSPKPELPTLAKTYESSIKVMASLENYDFLTTEIRKGLVKLTPTMEYNSNTSISGDFLSIAWEHNFSDDFGSELGIAVWKTNGMSQWIFEDVGIDFLDGRGMKWYLSLSDRISDYILLRLKFRQKLTEYPHTGLLAQDNQIHFRNGEILPSDFIAQTNQYNLGVQIDFLW
jgi:DNA uptake protein ComE-like DNA-binding protein